MMLGTGFMEQLIIALVALLSIGLPVVVLIFLFLIFRKLQAIEEKLGLP
jgi:hypothetical protein